MTDNKFKIITFGCKVNQYDSQLWRTALEESGSGFVENDGPADVYLINTCSVTASAEQQARQAVRKIIRNNPAAKVIIIGCYGQISSAALEKIEGVGLVLGRHSKENVGQLLKWLDIGPHKLPSKIKTFRGHTRAFIKVQDGCNHRCSYCIVPLARGASHSRPLDEVLSEAKDLINVGHRELVVAGVRLGDFKPSLGVLLRSLKNISGLDRIRLSSLEPDDVNEDLIETMRDIPNLARHLHLPLQNGCDAILKKMNRPYSVSYYRELLKRIRRALPEMTIGSDIIVGFPGETEEQFGQTCRNIQGMDFTHLHIFTYSKRPGTKASVMPGQIPETIKKERFHRLREIYQKNQQEYFHSLIGKTETVLTESFDSGSWSGLTEHYFRVGFKPKDDLKNKMVKVRLTGVGDDGMTGDLMEVLN